jgi:hypothetical protein
MKPSHRLVLLCICGLVLSAQAQAAVQGSCNYQGRNLALGDGIAARVPDADEPESPPRTTVWLTAMTLDHAALATLAPAKLDDAVTQQVLEHESMELQLRLDSDGKAVESLQLFVPPGSNHSISGNAVGTLTSKPVGAGHVAATYAVTEDEWRCKVSFDLGGGAAPAKAAVGKAVAAPAAAGQALPAGGGDPGKAYLALHRAALAGNADAIIPLLDRERATEMRQSRAKPEFPQMLAMIRMMEPAEVRVVSGRMLGDQASLQLEGKDSDGSAMTGEAKLVREDGQWKIANVSTESKASH